jgi:capsule polysaccharide export protein KpsC/LpsZ|tara:strand:+ start:1830 stop:2045 length:216 start_codon:yes stop_codon:yes gene_type:complete
MKAIFEFIQSNGWQIATILLGAVVFYDRYIAPLTKTKKDDEILEKILELLPEAIEERLLVELEEEEESGDK